MTGVNKGKRQVSGEEAQTNLSKTPGTCSSAQLNLVKPSKVTLKCLKKRILKALPASGTTGSGEFAKDKRRRVEPSGESGEKVAEGRSATVDNFKEVEERARLAVLHREEDTSKMIARLVKGTWLGIEEEKSELKKSNVKLEKELTRSRTDSLKEVMQLKASHVVAISQLQVETKANLDEMVVERDRLGRHLMLKGYSEEVVDAIKADTYAKDEDEEEVEVVGIVDGLDGISRQTVLDNQGVDIKLPEETFGRGDQSKGIVVEEERRIIKRYTDKGRVERRNWETHARVIELETMNLAESTKYIEKLEENEIYHAKVDAEMTELKNEYARLESCLERLRTRFAIMVIPDASQSNLLKAIVTYFIEEVKRLESVRDTLLKALSD
ncbi:hypothetical protein GIB67_034182 [Kingdonia uniflora]|uniref:Uncharacterized protein n=1 Tax=Kingdonia uniflora TaxID=39325 RepID=A0A7J7NRX1_9MAGN|nr:hypothetical protein GIB67_034182 [Kingdonia uniflora]